MHPSRLARWAQRSGPYGGRALQALPRLSGPRSVIGGRGGMHCDPQQAYWVFRTALKPQCLAGLGALGRGRLSPLALLDSRVANGGGA